MDASLGRSTSGRLALVEKFFAGTAGSYDFIVDATTVGADRRWKRRIAEAVPAGATRILDLASGTGILTFVLARRFPNARIVGVELRDEYLQISRRRARAQRIANVEFVLGRAEDFTASERFDAIVSSYLAKYADLEALVRMARALLEPAGVLVTHDFTCPSNPRTERLWRMQFRVIQSVFGRLWPAWRSAFDGLPELIAATRWVPELEDALARHGFHSVVAEELSAHGATMVSAVA